MNSKKIAEISGVSRSTVSKVLNNYPHINEKTREKVLNTIKDYNYIPNANAQALAGKKNSVIGVFIFEKDYEESLKDNKGSTFSYFMNFIDTCVKESFLLGYQVLVDVIKDELGEARLENYFKSGKIAGGIFIGLSKKNSFIDKITMKNYNICLIDYRKKLKYINKNIFLINSKDYEGAFLVTKELIDAKCKNILFLSGDEEKLTGSERRKGYEDALRENNISVREELILDGGFKKNKSYEAMKKFLDEKIEFDGVFCANDTMAYSVWEIIKNTNFSSIPIWGYDNLKNSFPLGIKTVSPLFNLIATEAIKSLIIPNYGIPVKYTEIKIIKEFEDYLDN